MVFNRNSEELIRLIEEGQKPENLERFWSILNRKNLDIYQDELIRLIHNFVAAAVSLIDHARVFFPQEYVARGEFREYSDEIDRRFKSHPLSTFIVCLRQFALHYQTPIISNDLNFQLNKPFSHNVNLSKSDLLSFSSWKPSAKLYLESCEEKISLLNIARDYSVYINDFYKWAYQKLEEIHADDIRVIEEKRQAGLRKFAPFVPQTLDAHIRSTQSVGNLPEEIFIGLIDDNTYETILRSIKEPLHRMDAYLEQVNKYAKIESDLQNRISVLFCSYYKL
jgi:hypothetical protein